MTIASDPRHLAYRIVKYPKATFSATVLRANAGGNAAGALNRLDGQLGGRLVGVVGGRRGCTSQPAPAEPAGVGGLPELVVTVELHGDAPRPVRRVGDQRRRHRQRQQLQTRRRAAPT